MVRRPTAAEMGDEVTIAIVALTAPYAHFVCVSDQMISFDDITQADDRAVVKTLQLCRNWSVAFAANKIENVVPLLNKVRNKIKMPAYPLSLLDLQEYFTTSIAEAIRADFFTRCLSRYGYRDMAAFRSHGRDELGDHFFTLCQELDKAELGVDFIVYGYETYESGAYDSCLFEVNGHGQIVDRLALRYAVVGSGYWMASASLRRKPLSIDFKSMVYRLLEAKFSAETATGVGKPTTVIVKRPNESDFKMSDDSIATLRQVWEAKMREPEPSEATVIVAKIGIDMRRDDNLHRKAQNS